MITPNACPDVACRCRSRRSERLSRRSVKPPSKPGHPRAAVASGSTRARSKCSNHSAPRRPHSTSAISAKSAKTLSDPAATSYGPSDPDAASPSWSRAAPRRILAEVDDRHHNREGPPSNSSYSNGCRHPACADARAAYMRDLAARRRMRDLAARRRRGDGSDRRASNRPPVRARGGAVIGQEDVADVEPVPDEVERHGADEEVVLAPPESGPGDDEAWSSPTSTSSHCLMAASTGR
jgi:hypothetical protein